ncbi:integral membrane protein TerC [Cryobacterium roopkundense]|uniref:Integral membrane protein TerC n=1 Tax=Cryobacterium roopkundense TaxID=1001240 RepID=A0A099JAF5_9MICO|nr:TerC family protein [Cryobacterium roopkundense]KGJ74473.1 integral membrane protein TerC [Cryobacterium roopkundense]MBB5643405.1 tellurite resistance protein TerC [Cryobacterium roopkundense]
MTVPLWAWFAVLGVILLMLAVDLVAHRTAHVIGVREAAVWSIVWVTLGVVFGVLVWTLWGAEFGQQYFAGYLIEKSLAVDNVFIWAIIFAAFAVPREYQHRVLFLGVLGALIFRGIFIAAGAALIENFSWILYVFAAFLIYTGWRMFRSRNDHVHPEKSRILKIFRRFVPMTDAYHGQKFLIRKAGIVLATPLLAVLVLVEITDIIFAVDSIPAIFAVTSEPFLVFTANAFAILGLRAMYFLLADLIHRFIYLKIGLAFVLIWVGIKMLLLDVFYIPTTISLAVVVTIITVSITTSLRATRGQGRREVQTEAAGAFRIATVEELAAVEPVFRRRGRVPAGSGKDRSDE